MDPKHGTDTEGKGRTLNNQSKARLVLVLSGLMAMSAAVLPLRASAGEHDPASPRLDAAGLDEVARYLETQREELGIPGLAAGIVSGDEVVLLEGFGETGSDGEAGPDGEAIEPRTSLMIASLSKSLTAIAVMQLVEAGTVQLDEPVSTYLPQLGPNGDGQRPGGDDVTVRDLLHHRSGLSTRTGRASIAGADGESLEANVARLAGSLEPGAPYEYSNANYDALALIVQEASGVAFADYMRDEVFGPLGMERSSAGEAARSGPARGHYKWLFAGYRPHDARMPPGMAGSATMFSSAEDLTHILIAQLNAGTYGGAQILSQASIDEMREPAAYEPGAVGGYAMGWHVFPAFPPSVGGRLSELTMLSHDGFWSTYGGAMWMVPEADLGFVMLTNGNDVTDDTQIAQVGRGVRAILFGLEPPPIRPGSPVLQRWGKPLLLAVVLGQVLLAVWTAMVLLRARRTRRMDRRGWTNVALATALDIAALVLLVWIVPATADAPLAVPFGYPDFRILFIAMIAGLVWGAVRSVLVALIQLTRARRPAPDDKRHRGYRSSSTAIV